MKKTDGEIGEPFDTYCEICQEWSHFSDNTPYGTCLCS